MLSPYRERLGEIWGRCDADERLIAISAATALAGLALEAAGGSLDAAAAIAAPIGLLMFVSGLLLLLGRADRNMGFRLLKAGIGLLLAAVGLHVLGQIARLLGIMLLAASAACAITSLARLLMRWFSDDHASTVSHSENDKEN